MRGHYSDVWRAIAQEFPARPAIVTRTTTYTYGRLAREASAFAAHLSRNGLQEGDAVAILSYNRPEYLVALFACFATGIAPVPINFRYRAGEVAELLRDAGARALLFPSSLRETATASTRAVDEDVALISIDEDGEGSEGAESFGEIVAAPGGTLPSAAPPSGELRLYTGGTTGRPKAVVWGVGDLFAVQQYATFGAIGLPLPTSMDEVLRIAADPPTPRIVTLPLAPFMHGTALFNSMNTLVLGGTVVIHASPHLDAEDAVRLAIDTNATRLIVAGDAVALPLVEAAEGAGITRLGAVDSILSSGMRLSAATKRRIHALGEIVIDDMLASTEGGPYAVNTTRCAEDLPGELRLLPGGVVLDDELREVQDLPQRRGRLAFRGPLPRGYWRDEQKTQETFPIIGGVRHVIPGDWALTLGDGVIELLGRGSAVVNTGGEKVFPAEVEEALLAFTGIRDAVVFGMPDARYGEVVTAMVVPENAVELDLDTLRAHLDARLAGYKRPRTIIVRDSLDRTPHGKLDLTRLKELAATQR